MTDIVAEHMEEKNLELACCLHEECEYGGLWVVHKAFPESAVLSAKVISLDFDAVREWLE